MSHLSPGLSSVVATVLGSHPSLRLLPISHYTQDRIAVYAAANGRAIVHMAESPDRQSILVALTALNYVSVCDVEHDLLQPGQEPVSLIAPELRKGLLARFHPVTAGDVLRIVEAVCPA